MQLLDWIVLGIFFLVLIGIIVWVLRQKEENTEDYFLAGKKAGWLSIGSSIFASNIGSEHLVGLAGAGFLTGMAMAHWEMHAWLILILGWVFVPFYDRIKVFTMPEFLERRFSRGSRTVLSVISLVSYILTKVAVTVYAGGVVFKEVFNIEYLAYGQNGWQALNQSQVAQGILETANFSFTVDFFWIAAIGLVVITGLYTIFGGMKAVLYTSVLQTPVLLFGSIVILVVGLVKVGGWSEVERIVGPNLKLVRSAADPEFPWTGVLLGSAIIGFWYWCTDQYIVQRVLSGRNRAVARKGAILAGYFKLLPVFIFLVPGMIAFALSQKIDPATGEAMLKVSSSDAAFASMVSQLLPNGITGIVVCGLLAALMSSLASLFNSSAMLFVEDFYKKYRPNFKDKHYVIVGRIATATVVILGVVWIPVMMGLGKVLYEYLQAVQGLLAPAIASVFLLGVFWKRTTSKGAFWGMITGFSLGMFRLVLNVIYGAKASFITSLERLKQQIAMVNDTRQGQVIEGLRKILDPEKLQKLGDETFIQPIQQQITGVIDTVSGSISPEAIQQSTSTLASLKMQYETLFINNYGLMYKLASINWLHVCIILFFISILTIVIVSLLTKKPSDEQLQYTYKAASAEDKALTRSGISVWDIVNTVIILGVVVLFYIMFW
jgi:solute:Na+ symporter, SSS family